MSPHSSLSTLHFLLLSAICCLLLLPACATGDLAMPFGPDLYDDEPLWPESQNELLIFSGVGCPPCEALKQALTGDEVAAAVTAGGWRVGVVEIDTDPDLASRFDVSNTPTSIKLRRGEEIDRKVGFRGEADYARWLRE
jgi:thiol-disulfide isomerase/thioredoxin